MRFSVLEINNFRNLAGVLLDLGDDINILYGNNGSGKTSFLEAIYFLSMGRSFRSQLPYLISYNCDQFIVFGNVKDDNNAIIPIGIERSRDGSCQMRVNSEKITAQAQITEILPLQLINTDGFRLLEAGPKYRRQFIDFGVFHVEHSFLSCWHRTQRALKQRNAILKQGLHGEQIEFWDKELESAGTVLHNLRSKYVSGLIPLIIELFQKLLNEPSLTIEYYPGWNIEKNLREILAENLTRDLKFKYTTVGPQKADLRLTINSLPVQDVLSRGQQKLLIFALRLAQGLFLYQQTGKNCIYLIDDVASELDQEKRRHVLDILKTINAQTFITGINPADLEDLFYEKNTYMFHVKHGEITRNR